MPLDFDYIGAKKAGYSDKEINEYLKSKHGFDFDIEGAKGAGYSETEISDYIKKWQPKKKKEQVGATQDELQKAFGTTDLKSILDRKSSQQQQPQPFKSSPTQKPIEKPDMVKVGKEMIAAQQKDPKFQENKKTFQEKVVKGADLLNKELSSNDDVAEQLIKTRKYNLAGSAMSEQLGQQMQSDATAVNVRPVMPEQSISVQQATPEEVQQLKTELNERPDQQRAFLKEVARAKPEKKKEIEAAMYRIDALGRYKDPEDYRVKNAEENAKKIEEGELIYDVGNGRLIKPEGFFGSIATGVEQRREQLSDYKFLSNASDEEAIKYIEDKLASQDPDKPMPIPQGKLAEVGGMLGSESVAIGKGAATTFVPGGQFVKLAAAAGVNAGEYYERGFGPAMIQAYTELVNQGVPKEEAIKKAREQANQEGLISVAEGGVSTILGARIGLRKFPTVNPKTASKVLNSVLKYSKEAAKDIATDAGVAGYLQYQKNLLAKEKGIARDEMEGVKENMEGEALFGLFVGLTAKGSQFGLDKGKQLLNLINVSKAPKEVTDATVVDLVQQGVLTEAEGEEALIKIDNQRKLNEQVPKDVSDEAKAKIFEKIEQRNELEGQLEKMDKAYHAPVKEKIKTLNEEIVALSNEKKPKEQFDKEALLEQAYAAAQQEMNPDYARAFVMDIEEGLREVAQQLNATESEAKTARQLYGDTISDIALKMFPDEKPPIGAAEMESQLKTDEEEVTEIPDQKQNQIIDTEKVSQVIEPTKKEVGKIETEQDFEAELSRLFDEKTDKLVSVENKSAKESTADDYLKKGQAVLEQLFPGVQITAYETSAEYEQKEGRPKGSAGMFDPQSNRIALNMEAIKSKGVENTIFHEVIHPIVNEANAKNENAVSDLFDQLESMKDEEGMDAVWEHMNYYASRGGKIQKVEAVTEFLSLVADGKINTSSLTEKTLSKIIDWINKAFEVLGINKRISTANDLKRLSDAVTKALQEGEMTDLQKVLAKSSPAKQISKLEQQREEAIKKVSKPTIKVEFIANEDLVSAKDPIAAKEKHDEIKAKYKNLKQLIECLW